MTSAAPRLDVWLALLNLELAFGTPASVKEVFERAVRQNDAETVHLKMAELYSAVQRDDDAERVLEQASKKFGATSLRVWSALGQCVLKRNNVAAFRRALQA